MKNLTGSAGPVCACDRSQTQLQLVFTDPQFVHVFLRGGDLGLRGRRWSDTNRKFIQRIEQAERTLAWKKTPGETEGEREREDLREREP